MLRIALMLRIERWRCSPREAPEPAGRRPALRRIALVLRKEESWRCSSALIIVK
tara:strand:- start:76 stop:237 length:162 start_codon:yes stop_codon:yes gene_type:complete